MLKCMFYFFFFFSQDLKDKIAAQVHQITDEWKQGILSNEQYFTALSKIGIEKNVIHEI